MSDVRERGKHVRQSPVRPNIIHPSSSITHSTSEIRNSSPAGIITHTAAKSTEVVKYVGKGVRP